MHLGEWGKSEMKGRCKSPGECCGILNIWKNAKKRSFSGQQHHNPESEGVQLADQLSLGPSFPPTLLCFPILKNFTHSEQQFTHVSWKGAAPLWWGEERWELAGSRLHACSPAADLCSLGPRLPLRTGCSLAVCVMKEWINWQVKYEKR